MGREPVRLHRGLNQDPIEFELADEPDRSFHFVQYVQYPSPKRTAGFDFAGMRRRHINPETIDLPGSLGTEAFGINNQGDVVGLYEDSQRNIHGFLYRNERFQQIDFPGEADSVAVVINGVFINISKCDGVNCGQAFLAQSKKVVVYIKAAAIF